MTRKNTAVARPQEWVRLPLVSQRVQTHFEPGAAKQTPVQCGRDRTHLVCYFQVASLTSGHLDLGWFRYHNFFVVRSRSKRLN
jgi:hypothetical protein